MKKILGLILIFIITSISFAGCGLLDNKTDYNLDDYLVNNNTESKIDTSNYIDINKAVFCKNVNCEILNAYFEINCTKKVYKEEVTDITSNDYTLFSSMPNDDFYYYYREYRTLSNGQLLTLNEIFYFPVSQYFLIKSQYNSNSSLYYLDYTYSYFGALAFKIRDSGNNVIFAGKYKHQAVNLNNYSAVAYDVQMQFRVPYVESPNKLCDASFIHCDWSLENCTNYSQAYNSFKSDADNLIYTTYQRLIACLNFLNERLVQCNSTYKVITK